MTNFIVYDLEAHNTDRARPYCISFHRLSKFAGRYDRDLSPFELQKCKKDAFVFEGDDCILKELVFLLKNKVEEQKVKSKIVEYKFQLHAHNGSGFDTWIILNNLPCDQHTVDFFKNGWVKIL